MSLNIESNFSITNYLEEEFSIERLHALIGNRVKSIDVKNPSFGNIVGFTDEETPKFLIKWDCFQKPVEVDLLSKITFMETLL